MANVSRMTNAERLAIEQHVAKWKYRMTAAKAENIAWSARKLLAELDAVTRERDEARMMYDGACAVDAKHLAEAADRIRAAEAKVAELEAERAAERREISLMVSPSLCASRCNDALERAAKACEGSAIGCCVCPAIIRQLGKGPT